MGQALHPDVAILAPLVGTWTGRGHGHYPTVTPFDYVETLVFEHVGKPFLAFSQRTKAVDDGRPLHAEQGYLRVSGSGRAELVLAHPMGIVEVQEGTIETADETITLVLASTLIGLTGSAKQVDAVERTMRFSGDTLEYTLNMAAVGHPMHHHLSATLVRHDPVVASI